MADGVDDDLLAPNLVEDEKRVGRCGQPPDIWIVGSETDLGMGWVSSRLITSWIRFWTRAAPFGDVAEM